MADYYLHKTAAYIDELLEKVEGLDNYDDTEVRGLINNKVDKEIGKGLSTNDFTDAYKTELDGLDTALNGKVDKETGKGLSTNDYTTSEKTKLNGIEAGANVNVQVDWNQTTTTADDYIKNKPIIPDAQIQSDWNQTNTESKDFIKNKPTIPAAQVNSDWEASSGVEEILHKPTLGTAAAKDYTTAVSGLSDDLITSSAVNTALSTKANLVDGKVPASELPSYVDDTVEGYYYEGAFYEDSSHTTAITGERGKIYVDLTTNKSYRWTGAIYTRVDECPAFGETQGTIYEGNKGKANADAIGTIANLTTTATDLVGAVNELNSDKVDKNGTDSLMTAAEHTKLSGIESGAEVNVQSDWNQTDDTADDFIKNKPTITTVNDATLTIQKNGTAVGTFSANAATATTVNITVPVDAEDVSALPDTTKYGASLALSIDSSTYVVTAVLKDQDGNTLGTAQTIDLPLETVVVGGSYDDATKKVILTLKNGNTIDFSVADLVAGLQTEITSTNKLDADLVDDTTSVHKFVTAADKTAWNAKSDFSGDYDDLTNKPTIPAAQVNADWNAVSGVAQILNKPTIPAVDQTYDASSTNAQSGTAVASAISGKISATDYATQNTGGTVKVWTTTDGSDTILHLATQ